jgi:recombination protein RecA
VADSVAALVPQAELEGDIRDSHLGPQARLMRQALRKLAGIVGKSNCCVIFINQLREKVGVMFGNPETTTGGRALKFFSTIRLDVRKVDVLKQGGEAVGNRVRMKVVKNKVAPPFRVAEADLMYGEGFSREGSLIDMGVANKLVSKTGAWFSYGDMRIGQGRENAKQFLKDNPEVAKEIETKLRSIMGTPECVVEMDAKPIADDE